MTELALQRPGVRMPFRWLVALALGLALIAFVAGRRIYERYGGYRPLALMHVPQTMRYRARVELTDAERMPALAPLLAALDPRGARRSVLAASWGESTLGSARELAFGVGPGPEDFVLVLGLQLQAETGLPPLRAVCDALEKDGIRSQPSERGCTLADGAIVAGTPDGMVVVASRPELVMGLLERPEIGDRLGFSGPSVRGVAPELPELEREARALARLIATRYP